MVMAFLGTWGSPKKSLAASTRVTLSRYTPRVRVSLADLQAFRLFHLSALLGCSWNDGVSNLFSAAPAMQPAKQTSPLPLPAVFCIWLRPKCAFSQDCILGIPRITAATCFHPPDTELSRTRMTCQVQGITGVAHPDSLKPMCPILPMPSSCTSMPPAALMAASYSAQNLHAIATCSSAAGTGDDQYAAYAP